MLISEEMISNRVKEETRYGELRKTWAAPPISPYILPSLSYTSADQIAEVLVVLET